MQFVIKINMDNDAFVCNNSDEIKYCLQQVINKMDDGNTESSGNIKDSNGNTVGFYEVDDES